MARHLLIGFIVAAAYFCAAKLGLSLALVHASASAVWPAAGLALAAALLLGRAAWAGILLGAFAANLSTEGSLATSLAIACGNTLEAVVGAWLLKRRAAGPNAFNNPAGLFRFVGLAALAASSLSPTVGVSRRCAWVDLRTGTATSRSG